MQKLKIIIKWSLIKLSVFTNKELDLLKQAFGDAIIHFL